MYVPCGLWPVNDGELDISHGKLQAKDFICGIFSTTQILFIVGSRWILGGFLVDLWQVSVVSLASPPHCISKKTMLLQNKFHPVANPDNNT